MNHNDVERVLAEHRLAGPDPDLRTRALARAEAAWRNSDGFALGLQLWGFARKWGLGVAAALVLNLAVDGLGPNRGNGGPASASVAVAQEWQDLCHELELPEAWCRRLRLMPEATAQPADAGPERRRLERELDLAG